MAEKTGNREMDLFLKALMLVSDPVKIVGDVMLKLLEEGDPLKKELAFDMRNEDTAAYQTTDFSEAYRLRRHLTEAGIACEAVGYERSVYVIVPGRKLKEAQQVVDAFYQDKSAPLCSDSFLRTYAASQEESVKTISGLTQTEAEYYRQLVQAQGLTVSLLETTEGFSISYLEQDQDKMDRIRLSVAAASQGPAESLYQKQAAWKKDYDLALLSLACTGAYPDHCRIPEGTVIADAVTKRIEFQKDGIRLIQAGNMESISYAQLAKSGGKTAEQVRDFFVSMREPVLLSKEQDQTCQKLFAEERKEYRISQMRKGIQIPKDAYQNQLLQAAGQQTDPQGYALRNGDRIVAKNGMELSFEGDLLRLSVPEKPVQTFQTGDPTGRESVMQAIREMEQPIFLTAAEAVRWDGLSDAEKEAARSQLESEKQTVLAPRPVLQTKDLELLKQSERLQQMVEVRLKAYGTELPKTERIPYAEAAVLFGLTKAEHKGIIKQIQTEAPDDPDILKDNTDGIAERIANSHSEASNEEDLFCEAIRNRFTEQEPKEETKNRMAELEETVFENGRESMQSLAQEPEFLPFAEPITDVLDLSDPVET